MDFINRASIGKMDPLQKPENYLRVFEKVNFFLLNFDNKSIMFLDPYNVHMQSVSDESINAVADILRSFFRQLEKPLIPEEIHNCLYEIGFFSNFFFKLIFFKF